MLKIIQKYIIYILVLAPVYIFSQSQDSLLKQISEIDIELDASVDAEENLFMNSVSFQSFYDVLSPMGEWIQITKEDIDEDLNDGEGQSFSSYFEGDDELLFIWKPQVENGWKPYMNGKWEYTDHGWLWISSDKWGNSTYNYGRWWNSPKYGWVWLPGYTWAPAWVRWKVTGNHYGWTALTPKAKWKSENGITGANYKYNNSDKDWVFVNDGSFAGDISNTNVVPVSENSMLVKSGNDIIGITSENEKIITSGPDVNDVEKHTGKKYGKKKLRFNKGKEKPLVGNEDIVMGREKFNKYSLNNESNEKTIDKPKKFKKSERVKKILRKKHQHKQNPRKNTPRK
jgi:hypothetical protein